MYRLVVCDVDGTLLFAPETKIANSLFVRVNNLCNMGVEFAVASGRTYHELEKMFFPVYGRITFLCNNGGVIIRNRRVMFQMPFDRLDVLTFAQKVRDEFGVNVILYGAKSSYYIGEDPAFIRKMHDLYGTDAVQVASVSEIDADIFKACFSGLTLQQKQYCSSWAPSGSYLGYDEHGFTEYLPMGADKGIALSFWQQKQRISAAQTVAFGDNRNDVSMLRCAEGSYAMKNAKVDLSNVAKYTTESVEKTLDDLFF